MPVLRPLVGTDKVEILDTAKKIGTYDISSEPFHDCCPVFMPRTPALSASPEQLMQAEAGLDIQALIAQGLRDSTVERFSYSGGQVEVTEPAPIIRGDQRRVVVA
jgi:thiamine biosynthesis protein ThiI